MKQKAFLAVKIFCSFKIFSFSYLVYPDLMDVGEMSSLNTTHKQL